ncbi:MAG: transcriptional regulator [Methanothrix sp.]
MNRIPETQTAISDRRKSPCEMVIWDVLPSIRAAIAEELMKRDLPQKEISRLLGITPPAVSQYLSKKRGYNIEFGEEIKVSISQLADDLVEKKIHNPVERICEICRMLREDEKICGSDDHKCE